MTMMLSIIDAKKQKGAATLFMSLVILVLITLVIIYTARIISLEVKTSSVQLRSKQALEAADSGVEWAKAHWPVFVGTCVRNVVNAHNPDSDSNGVVNSNDCWADSDGDGDIIEHTVSASSVFSVTITDTGSVTSQGFSDDKSATRTINVDITGGDGLPNPPKNPFTSYKTTTFTGSASVYNPEGHTTIWSGQATDLGSNNAMATYVANPADGNYPSCMDHSVSEVDGVSACSVTASSNKTAVGLDVVESDANLAALTSEGFFTNFFGVDYDGYKSKSFVRHATSDSSASNSFDSMINLTRTAIWVDTADTSGVLSISGNGSIGCSTTIVGVNADPDGHPSSTCPDIEPSILIVDGDFDVQGTWSFYGLVYIIGDLIGNGNFNVEGAIIVEGNGTPSGSIDVWYNSDMLGALGDLGTPGTVAGTWRDFPVP